MTTPPSAAFLSRAERWKGDLLDLSRRNRTVYYRPSKTTTLRLPSTPADTWRVLVDEAERLTFAVGDFHAAGSMTPPGESPATQPTVDAATDAPEMPTTAEPSQSGGRPPGRVSPPASPDDIAKSVRALAERARIAAEEQGVRVLYVAFGMLHWVDAADRKAVASPLLLVPVQLSFERSAGRVVVTPAEGELIELNPSLVRLLEAMHRVRLPATDLEPAEGEGPSALDTALEAVRGAIANNSDWRVDDGPPLLDVFSFRKIAIVREIERSLDRLAAHPILRALAGEDTGGAIVAPKAFEDLDEELPPDALRLVVSADSSQLRAVASAANGASMVIQGPPGTGKSQTITNVIGELLAQQKTVLFVAEKAVARDVVLANLADAGLAEACLHVRAEAGSLGRRPASAKASVVDDILATLERGPLTSAADDSVLAAYGEARGRLNRYARELHASIGLGGWTTPFALLEEALSTPGTDQDLPGIPSIHDAERRRLDQASEAVQQVADAGSPALAALRGPWNALAPSTLSVEDENGLRAALTTLSALPEEAASALAGTNSMVNVATATVDDLRALATRLQGVARYPQLAGSLLRWAQPVWYAARKARAAYLADGGTVAGAEGAAGNALAAVVVEAASASDAADRLLDPVPRTATATEIGGWAANLVTTAAQATSVVEVRRRLDGLETLGVRRAVEQLILDRATSEDLVPRFRGAVLRNWTDEALSGDLLVEPRAHERLIEEFSTLDAQMLEWSRAHALNGASSRRPNPKVPVAPGSDLAELMRYAKAKRRPSLRRILSRAPVAVQNLKPCMLMSPLAVAQYLGGDGAPFTFDVCILDEASMVATADMVVPIGLARQVILCGDSKQMPPTAFFDRLLVGEPGSTPDDDEEPEFESILDEASAGILPSVPLLWHYRSRDESLIAFSNHYFYRGKLVAFPDVEVNPEHSGVRFDFVADAVYGRGGSRANPQEADRAVAILTEHLTDFPEREVAITAMSSAQQAAINERIEAQATGDSRLQDWVDAGGRAKNLETVQGDECDTMILSLGYGRDAGGRLIMNFGPLGQTNGDRRLNVAITRARWQTILVSSIHAADIRDDDSLTEGARRLRDYLDYAERGPSALPGVAASALAGPFEAAIAGALTRQSIGFTSRVGVGGYPVEVAVLDPNDPTRYRLATETDGHLYASAGNARDRELLRPSVLRRMGWIPHRAWSTAWWRDAAGETSRLVARLSEPLDSNPTTAPADPTPAPVAAPTACLDAPASPYARWVDHPAVPHPAGSALIAAAPVDIASDLEAILEQCGPLHCEDLYRFAADAHGIDQLNARLRSALAFGLQEAVARGVIVERGEFAWLAALSTAAVPVRRIEDGQERSSDRIPPEEAARALQVACVQSGRIPIDSIARAIAAQLGYQRTTEALDALAMQGLRLATDAGRVVEADGYVTAT